MPEGQLDSSKWFVRGLITRWVSDDPQPGIVEFQLTDSAQVRSLFIGKFYDFTTEDLFATSHYPLCGFLSCAVLSHSHDEAGRHTVQIDTDATYRGHESEDGSTVFTVQAELLVLHALPEWKTVPLIPLRED